MTSIRVILNQKKGVEKVTTPQVRLHQTQDVWIITAQKNQWEMTLKIPCIIFYQYCFDNPNRKEFLSEWLSIHVATEFLQDYFTEKGLMSGVVYFPYAKIHDREFIETGIIELYEKQFDQDNDGIDDWAEQETLSQS